MPTRALGVLLAMAWLAAAGVPPLRAQAGVTVTAAPAPSVVFGEVIVFEVEAASAGTPITGVTLHLQPASQPAFAWTTVQFQPGAAVSARATVDVAAAALPPFSLVAYWWAFETSAGATLTPPATFYYEDDRFAWQTLTRGSLTLHWYAGDAAFGQSALNIATGAYATANHDLRAPLPERLDLYIYASPRDVQAALQRVGAAWADGHADAALGVVIVVTPPDLSAEFNLQREIPHELTHILFYRAAADNYHRVPAWLNEGLALMNQAQPEPDLPAVLAAARDSGKFLAMTDLCGPFDPAHARLAYAQSESFTRYLRGRFGSERLHALVSTYAAGAGCAQGVEQALGLPLDALEAQWLADVAAPNAAPGRWRLLAPWLVLGALILLGPILFFLLILRPGRAA